MQQGFRISCKGTEALEGNWNATEKTETVMRFWKLRGCRRIQGRLREPGHCRDASRLPPNTLPAAGLISVKHPVPLSLLFLPCVIHGSKCGRAWPIHSVGAGLAKQRPTWLLVPLLLIRKPCSIGADTTSDHNCYLPYVVIDYKLTRPPRLH